MISKSASGKCGESAFTLPEVMISTTIFSAICIGLLMGFTGLERNYAAATDFAVNHADEMRISDYMALDLRRALAVVPGENDTVIQIPAYYDDAGEPQTPILDSKGGVYYAAHDKFVRIHYYLSDGTIYRQEDAKSPTPLAVNVQDFHFNVTDLGKVVQTSITFNPTFSSSAGSKTAAAATSFYNTTLLRNSRTDMKSSVY